LWVIIVRESPALHCVDIWTTLLHLVKVKWFTVLLWDVLAATGCTMLGVRVTITWGIAGLNETIEHEVCVTFKINLKWVYVFVSH